MERYTNFNNILNLQIMYRFKIRQHNIYLWLNVDRDGKFDNIFRNIFGTILINIMFE